MTEQEAAAAMDEVIAGGRMTARGHLDPEASHIKADGIVEEFLMSSHPELWSALQRVQDACDGHWWFA